ncbi:hypothetical protein [Saccharicrinis fermentans]|uniref:Uncharacterized protein n=1 Tax=Saccharicrinis fermentans DSM 9555 = JCM 21142 TaxID=869213 RepID=W7YB48_9BACT|nr:hypothetical protein [Saccharicrinis fermentans]GAF01591.1 hypothetical protein JCM21142_203 [Saccharicrinis fermentans DSM 9555 = JCM 21142]
MLEKEKYNESPNLEGAIGYWMYNVQEDTLRLPQRIKHILGLNKYSQCAFSSFKSIIIGADIPRFVKGFNAWINGDTSKIIQVRIVDSNNIVRVIQIKGHLRTDIRNSEMVLYGAYINISYWTN